MALMMASHGAKQSNPDCFYLYSLRPALTRCPSRVSGNIGNSHRPSSNVTVEQGVTHGIYWLPRNRVLTVAR